MNDPVEAKACIVGMEGSFLNAVTYMREWAAQKLMTISFCFSSPWYEMLLLMKHEYCRNAINDKEHQKWLHQNIRSCEAQMDGRAA